MVAIVITDGCIDRCRVAKLISILTTFLLLSGCLGGTIAQQIARSIATSVADNAIANAMDVDEDDNSSRPQTAKLTDRPPSELSIALMNSGFRAAPTSTSPREETHPTEKSIQIIQTSALVRVKLFNLIISDEKNAVYKKAHRMGVLNLPAQLEWKSWHVASGVIEGSQDHVTFLIPPELGKPPSGSLAIVELGSSGNFHIARYLPNKEKVYQAMDQSSHSSWQ